MTREFRYLLTGFVLFAACVLVVLAALDGRGRGSDRWTVLAMARKDRLAQATPSPKMVLVGGSNVLFGLRAGQIAGATSMPAINLAVRDALGASYILFAARPHLKPGDVVVLAFENALWGPRQAVTPLVATLSLARGDGYWQGLPWPEKLRYLWAVLHPDALRQILAADSPTFPYEVGNIDDFGDERSNLTIRASLRPEAVTGIAELPVAGVGNPEILEFIAWSRANGVRVLATWPNVVEHASDPEVVTRGRRALVAQLGEHGVPMIGAPEDATLPVGLMYDTVYHPTDEGAALRTSRFLAALCRAEAALCRTGVNE